MESKSEATSPPAEPADLPASYEAALEELEVLVAKMEAGNLQLEASLKAYERGTVLVSYCQKQLEHVEQQVRILEGGEEGSLKPWSAQDTLADA
jgi:exodeoxyribonuclease VII small subunit